MPFRLAPLLLPVLLATIVARPLPAADPLPRFVPSPGDLKEADRRGALPPAPGRAYREKVTPNWFADGSKFWYRNDLKAGTKEFVVVDAAKGARRPAFDHAKLAASLSKAAGKEYTAGRLPFQSITLDAELTRVRFSLGGDEWACDLTGYECVKQAAPAGRVESSRSYRAEPSTDTDDQAAPAVGSRRLDPARRASRPALPGRPRYRPRAVRRSPPASAAGEVGRGAIAGPQVDRTRPGRERRHPRR